MTKKTIAANEAIRRKHFKIMHTYRTTVDTTKSLDFFEFILDYILENIDVFIEHKLEGILPPNIRDIPNILKHNAEKNAKAQKMIAAFSKQYPDQEIKVPFKVFDSYIIAFLDIHHPRYIIKWRRNLMQVMGLKKYQRALGCEAYVVREDYEP